MRIIAGRFRRRSLHAPKGRETRPTTDRTRESLFNLVEARMPLEGADVLDLFTGTGALALEALSRGAAAATLVEHNGHVLKYAQRNAEELEVDDAVATLRADAVTYLKRYAGPPFDLILADPPYDLEAMAEMPALALPHVKEGGLFVLEHDARIFFDEHPQLDVSRRYGRTVVTIFRP